MFAVLSPAKTLDETPLARPGLPVTAPALLADAEILVRRARTLEPAALRDLMGISDALASLNHARFQRFTLGDPPQDAKPAALLFAGDTYAGLKADQLDDDALSWAQDRVGLLSGLYGLLRPLDLIQPHRLEMGTALATRRGPNLYAFWADRISARVNALTAAHGDRTLVNLASAEYFRAIRPARLKAPVVTAVFEEVKDGAPRVIGLVAKRARGLMARWIIDQRVDRSAGLKDFAVDDYAFTPDRSTADTWTFSRPWRTAAGFQ